MWSTLEIIALLALPIPVLAADSGSNAIVAHESHCGALIAIYVVFTLVVVAAVSTIALVMIRQKKQHSRGSTEHPTLHRRSISSSMILSMKHVNSTLPV
ncbi:hypothetical protein NEOLEDRAFT_1135798 [Neolentinus lepideus HHB14362 ss-1]|uniref:Uncharacterized protein n=1 Tax=Neolentinus lepideus HHB14362 ss-1 TaxID=1314782 RepID=A0A165RL05_9AGAM|nr:hypothetical protein NEOLEDRAFT_1135798 [Neolentinus lepideus HHB14362 ss-1]